MAHSKYTSFLDSGLLLSLELFAWFAGGHNAAQWELRSLVAHEHQPIAALRPRLGLPGLLESPYPLKRSTPAPDETLPCSVVSSSSRLSTPPRNTASLQGPMLVHLRNKTQKQIKWQFLFKQERGQALGIPGQRPSVPTLGDRSPQWLWQY